MLLPGTRNWPAVLSLNTMNYTSYIWHPPKKSKFARSLYKLQNSVWGAGSYDVLFYFAEGDALDSLVDALRLMQAAQRALANGSHFTLLLATERTQPPQLDEHLGNGLMNCKNPGWKMLEVPKRPGDQQHQRETIHHLMIFNSLIIHHNSLIIHHNSLIIHDIYLYIIHS